MNPSKLTYPSQAAEDAVETFFIDHINHHAVSDKPCWRIKWRGVFIKTHSGKSSWRTIGHAKLAFRNHIAQCNLVYWYERNLTGNVDLTYLNRKITENQFWDIIQPEIEYIQA